jgi:hypothetical protein
MIMKNKSLKIPAIIIAIALILAVVAHLATSVCKKPTITEQDFNYSITYKLNGETKTLKGVYTCRFDDFGNPSTDPLERYYSGEYKVEGNAADRSYTIDEKDGYELYIVALLNESYLMGDTKNDYYEPSLPEPYLEASDKEGNQYGQDELPSVFDAEIVSWEYPEPIENTFVFAKFAGFHSGSTMAMLLVVILALVMCMILVKKDEDVTYRALDRVGIVFNFLTFFAVLPIISLAAFLIQAFPTGPSWIYQAYLCIPPIIPLSIAASLSLRRKGFRISGFFVQFLGLVIVMILAVLEYVL